MFLDVFKHLGWYILIILYNEANCFSDRNSLRQISTFLVCKRKWPQICSKNLTRFPIKKQVASFILQRNTWKKTRNETMIHPTKKWSYDMHIIDLKWSFDIIGTNLQFWYFYLIKKNYKKDHITGKIRDYFKILSNLHSYHTI
jgi:hypothetical protein